MDNKKRYKSAVWTLFTLSFILIAAICAMMWGKSIASFPLIKLVIFITLIILEAVTLTAEFICAAKLGKINSAEESETEDTAQDKPVTGTKQQNRGMWLAIAGIGVSCLLAVCGTFLGGRLSAGLLKLVLWLCIAFDVIPAVMLLVSVIRAKSFAARIKSEDVAYWQDLLLSKREDAAETAEERLDSADALISRGNVCAITVGIMGTLASLLSGMSLTAGTAALFAVGALWVVTAFSRLRFPLKDEQFLDRESAVSEEDFPELYALVRQAQTKVGVEGELVLSLTNDCNAGIFGIDGVCSVTLGVMLLGIMTEAELYTVLLHEFEHLASSDEDDLYIRDYYLWRSTGGNRSVFSPITDLMFEYNDEKFVFDYLISSFACSILYESMADTAMVRFGDAAIAESALRKLKYCELYEWENALCDTDVYYKDEEPDRNYIGKQLDGFLRKMTKRYEVWNELLDREILARNASHPTAKQRIEALWSYAEEPEEMPDGVEEPPYFDIKAPTETKEYRVDCARALKKVQDDLYDYASENYESDRQERYIKPLETVTNWELPGRPVIAEEYADIVGALLDLGRCSEAVALCDRVISELNEKATYYACFIKASALLRAYDAGGIELMYKAIEGNSNYINDGIALIGTFCCYTGNGEELAVYREKAIELARSQQKKYDEISVLRKTDELMPDPMSDEMLDEILGFILNEDEYAAIKRIYLIRKTISEDFFTSVFIMQFVSGTDDEVKQYLLHRMFCCLDVRDEQYSLFDYDEVKDTHPEKVENSLVFERPDEEYPEE